jgi:aldose 1-epimerase
VPAPTLTLSAGNVDLTVHPAHGARIGQITVADQPLLIDPPLPIELPGSKDASALAWGSYPMAPWAGRIRGGRFTFEGIDHQLVVNHHDGDREEQAHAIHGLVFDRPWDDVYDVSDTTFSAARALEWPFGGIARQTIVLTTHQVVLTLSVESTGQRFPAEIGWHPWFRKPARLEFSPTAMYERDEWGIPTGQLVDPPAPPWDDCFCNTDAVTLQYERPVAPAVRVESDCDHWVVYDQPAHATCVEPQSGPPDAFTLAGHEFAGHIVDPDNPLRRTMTISW